MESLIEELCDKEESFVDVDITAGKQREKINAQDVRMKALERVGETKKRKSHELDGDPKPKKTRRGSNELVEYQKQKSSTDSERRREEIEIKKSEQEIQKQTALQAGAM